MNVALVGGFLGSGKTTAIVTACQYLMKQGKKVAVVTNDQGDQQVDSVFVKTFGISTREVSNGCFCCNYNQLEAHLQSLAEQDQPDIIFAESVGSCTDLIATIAKPLNQLKPDLAVSISIVADADLLCAILEGRSSFLEESIRYIYKKQLEEADILIINKTDLLSLQQLSNVKEAIHSDYRDKIILYQNAHDENDIALWLDKLNGLDVEQKRNSLTIDYDTYGAGEAQLAWLDKRITIKTAHDDGIFVAQQIIGAVFDELQARHLTIGHLKFFLETDHWNEKISFTTTSTSRDLKNVDIKSKEVRMLINARVQTEPELLKTLIDRVCTESKHRYGCTIIEEKWSAFKPGHPRPTHRITTE